MNRSFLMVAGDKEKHLLKIPHLPCDTAMINLEDGVFDKEYARNLIQNTYPNGLKVPNKQIVVRVNALDECADEDIQVINKLKPDAIRIPKVKTKQDIQKALKLIDEDIQLHISCETKEALENLHTFKLNQRVTTVYLGILDMLESLGLPQSLLQLDNPTIDYILSKFLIDCKIAGLHPVSFTYQDYKNTQEFTQWCHKIKKMGYTSKAVISPDQATIVNEILSNDDNTIEKAHYIKMIFERNKQNGITGFVDEKYGFIDEPIYKDALLVLKDL